MVPENELLKLARLGNRDAFNNLVNNCSDKIYNLAFRLTGNGSDAKDLWQESFLKAYKNIVKFKQRCSFSTWVYEIALNIWKDRVRYEKRRNFLKMLSLDNLRQPGEESAGKEYSDSLADPEQETGRMYRHELILKILDSFDSRTKMIIVLCVFENRTYKEVSKIAGCSLRTVNSKVCSFREMVKDKLFKGENYGV